MIEGETKDGKFLKMRMAVAKVNKVLASVARICENGTRVVFDEDGSYVMDKKTGRNTEIHKRIELYMLDLHVPRSKETEVAHEQDKKQEEWLGICNRE